MIFNSSSGGEEWVDVEAREDRVFIMHRAQRDSSASGTWVTSGSDVTLIIRYFIFNRPTPIVAL